MWCCPHHWMPGSILSQGSAMVSCPPAIVIPVTVSANIWLGTALGFEALSGWL